MATAKPNTELMYKNYTNKWMVPEGYVHKILLIMRLTTLMLIATMMQVSAASFGQRVTLKKNNASLKSIFLEIRKQTGYTVLYRSDQLLQAKPVKVNLTGALIEDAMEQILSGQGMDYAIEDKTIVVKLKEKSIFDKLIEAFKAIDVSGRIVDEKGNPVAGATIKVKGTGQMASSGGDGSFVLKNVAEDALLQITYIGFQTRELKAAVSLGSIVLVVEVGKLQEVMVNAGYYSVKDGERTGSISRITSKDIEKQPVANVLATMQGRMAGVNITQTTGVPGGEFAIQVRGQNSIRQEGNSPLYIIDGVPYASDAIGYNQTSTLYPGDTSPLNSINPDGIESIEILKDADATAIYGSRGANGVVLITTKKGKVGKSSLTITPSKGLGTVSRFREVMDKEQYFAMRLEGFKNDKVTTFPANAYDVNGTWDQNRFTDWQKELIGGTAEINAIQGSLTGGSQQTQFMLNANYRSESTVFPGDFLYQKGGARFNLNHRSADGRFKLVFSSGLMAQQNNQTSQDLINSTALPPNAPTLYDAAGNLNWENNTWTNPLATLVTTQRSNTKDLLANAVLSYEIMPSLVLKSSFGYTDLQHVESRAVPSTLYSPGSGVTSESASSLLLTNSKRNSWIIEPQLDWTKEFAGGRLGVLLGGTFQQQRGSRLAQMGAGFSSNSLIYDLSSAITKQVLLNDETLYKYQAFFARVNYNWKDRYILNLTARRDGSSRFGPGNQFANFGAIGAAWLFSNESFLEQSAWLSSGKLRGSYGITGSDQIGDYQFLDTYSSTSANYQTIVGLQPTRLFNADFGWETNKKLEAALELGFLADRILVSGAWYRNRSSNQLVGIPLPATTGFTQIQANLKATVQNTGLEFTVSSVNFSGKNFNWTCSVNISISRNKLISFPGLAGSTYRNRYRIGEPLNMQLSYRYLGVNPQTGIYEYVDENKDGVISSPDDRQTVVDLNPAFFGGFENQLSYKRWKLDFLFQFVKQRNLSGFVGLGGSMFNRSTAMLDRWRKPGDVAKYQLYSSGLNAAAVSAQSRYRDSDAAIVDASYIRLKNLSLNYEIPLRLKAVRVTAMLQGQNLLVFTPYRDGDPEFTLQGSIPPLRVISAGAQLNF